MRAGETYVARQCGAQFSVLPRISPNSPLHAAEIAASLHGTYVAIKIK
jgi:hypothetical protein